MTPGGVAARAASILRVQWNRENHRFILQRDDDPEVVAPYTVSDTAPASDPHKTLIVLHLEFQWFHL
jgi:hypothetical protein